MKKFKLTLIETLEKTVEIEAESISEAQRIALGKYDAAEDGFVLTADNSQCFIEIGETDEVDDE